MAVIRDPNDPTVPAARGGAYSIMDALLGGVFPQMSRPQAPPPGYFDRLLRSTPSQRMLHPPPYLPVAPGYPIDQPPNYTMDAPRTVSPASLMPGPNYTMDAPRTVSPASLMPGPDYTTDAPRTVSPASLMTPPPGPDYTTDAPRTVSPASVPPGLVNAPLPPARPTDLGATNAPATAPLPPARPANLGNAGGGATAPANPPLPPARPAGFGVAPIPPSRPAGLGVGAASPAVAGASWLQRLFQAGAPATGMTGLLRGGPSEMRDTGR